MSSCPVVMAVNWDQAPAFQRKKEKSACAPSQPRSTRRDSERLRQIQAKTTAPAGTSTKDCLQRAEQATRTPPRTGQPEAVKKMPAPAKRMPSAVCQGMQGKLWMPKMKPAVARSGRGMPSFSKLKIFER